MKTAILILCTVLLISIIFFEPLRFIDNLFYDLNFAFSPKAASDSVVVVAIDAKSLSAVGGWPWSRTKLAEMISQIDAMEPRVVALDILLPKRDAPAHDANLAAALSRVDNCIIPFRAVGLSGDEVHDPVEIPPNIFRHRFLLLANAEDLDGINLYRATDFDASDTMFTRFSRYSGFLNVSTSNTSQKIREVIHVLRAGNEYFPSFGLSAVAAYKGLKPDEFVLDGRGRVILRDEDIPVSSYAASAFVNFRSQANPVVTVSAMDIFNNTARREMLRDKLVFIGVDDPAAGSDFFTTPIASQYAGVKVWATSALDILEKTWVRNGGGLPGAINWLLALLLFPGLALLAPLLRKQAGIIIGIVVLLLSIVTGIILFRQFNYFWNPAHHLFAWLFSVLWIATQKPVSVTKVVEALQLDPPVDATEEILEPPSKDFVLPHVPHTATALHALQTIVPGIRQIPKGKADITAKDTDDEDVETMVLPRGGKSAPAAPGSVSEKERRRLQELCNGNIVRVLGSGGMADVYLIWNPRLEMYRAVKVMKPGQSDSLVERFETEIRIFAKLDHPNIVHCYTEGNWHSLPYLEMEYINGASLEEFLRKCDSITPEQAAVIGVLIARALHYAHRHVIAIESKTYHGVIHRDLKPANVMISRSGRVKLTDFGIARPVSVSLHTSDKGNIVGTLPYLAPEQFEGEDLDARTDIYALGIMLFEMLSGSRAFPQKDIPTLMRAKTEGKIKIDDLAGVPLSLMDIIEKAARPDRNQRYATANDMCADLEDFLLDRQERPGYEHMRDLVRCFRT
jgi:serine/threonine-protein kinase